MNTNKREYGGFLPLELRNGKEYFCQFPIRRYNSANAALDYLINTIIVEKNIKRVFIPYYLCPNVCAEVEKHKWDVHYYTISSSLMPDVDLVDEPFNCYYIVNYFGIMDNRTIEFVNGIKKAVVIIDFCHSFFCAPVMKQGVYNIFSARKFFGVPDGAYLIASNLPPQKDEYSCSSSYCSYLFDSLEYGTNYAYDDKKRADQYIGKHHGNMSFLAYTLLCSIDYEYVKKKRIENYLHYSKSFSTINHINCESGSVPYIYPLNCGKDIRRQLIEKKIYVPTLWGQLLSSEFKQTFEYWLTKNTLFLPLDQRYGYEDIECIISIVKGLL